MKEVHIAAHLGMVASAAGSRRSSETPAVVSESADYTVAVAGLVEECSGMEAERMVTTGTARAAHTERRLDEM